LNNSSSASFNQLLPTLAAGVLFHHPIGSVNEDVAFHPTVSRRRPACSAAGKCLLVSTLVAAGELMTRRAMAKKLFLLVI
jgi:hypothetical protein